MEAAVEVKGAVKSFGPLRAVIVKGLPPWGEPVGLAGVLVFLVFTVAMASITLRASARE